jgi:putative redox protein
LQKQIRFANHRREKLAGTLHVPVESSPYGIILGHCFTCSRHTSILQSICRELEDRRFMVLRFDFSGNGQSEGSFPDSTISKQIIEMNTAADFLMDKGISWIGLAGHSVGGTVALLAAPRIDAARAVCTLAATASLPDKAQFLADSERQQLEISKSVHFTSRGRSLELTVDFFQDASQYTLADTLPSLSQPLLIVHGDGDEIVPVEEAHRLRAFRPARTELAIVSGADHMFGQEPHRQQVTQKVARWFEGLRDKGIADCRLQTADLKRHRA